MSKLGGLLSAYTDSDESGGEEGASPLGAGEGKGSAAPGGLLGIGDYGAGEEHHSDGEEGELGVGRAVLTTDRTPPVEGPAAASPLPDGGGVVAGSGAAAAPPAATPDGTPGHQGGATPEPEGRGAENGGGNEEEEAPRPPSTSYIPEEFKADVPPGTEEGCAPELQAKIDKYLSIVAQGKSINDEFRKSKGYRNPDFMSQIVDYFGINETGSNFPPEVFDPRSLPEEDFRDKISEFQRNQSTRKEEERKARSQVAFTSGAGGGGGGGGAAPAARPAVGVHVQQPQAPTPAAIAAQLKLAQVNMELAGRARAAAAAATGGGLGIAPPSKRSKWDK